MLDQLTFEQMNALVGTTFRVELAADTIELRLVRAAKVMESEAARLKRTPFSLFFEGPVDPLLPQMTYPLQHQSLERLEIFLVPVSRDARCSTYEAVFT
jgi:hypothetical protein